MILTWIIHEFHNLRQELRPESHPEPRPESHPEPRPELVSGSGFKRKIPKQVRNEGVL